MKEVFIPLPTHLAAQEPQFEPCDYCALLICGPEHYSNIAEMFICPPCAEILLENGTRDPRPHH